MEGHVNTHQQRPPFDEAEGGVPEGLTLAERARAARDRLPASLPAAGPDLLVALDIDGTLLGHDGTLAAAVRDAVTDLVESGTHVVLSTGRAVPALLPVAEMLGLSRGWTVCSNGAVVGTLAHASPLRVDVTEIVTFDPTDALDVLGRELPGAHFAVEIPGGFKVNRPFPPGELTGEEHVVPFAELSTEPVTRVTMRAPELDAQDFHEMVERVGLHGVGYAVGWTAWLDISPEGVTKASALESVRERLGVGAGATVAIGDGMNDLEMLGWAAHGVAMGNASARLHGVADAVTGTVQDDGAAVILRALLG